MVKNAVVILLAVLLPLAAAKKFNATHDFTFKCDPRTESLRVIKSVHQKSVGGKVVSDRAWEFECRKTRLPPSTLEPMCIWGTGYVGDEFKCPLWDGGVISGVRSDYEVKEWSKDASNGADNTFYQRLWNYRCCYTPYKCPKNCLTSGNVNEYGGVLEYNVPDGYFLAGAKRKYSGKFMDDIWTFTACKLEDCE